MVCETLTGRLYSVGIIKRDGGDHSGQHPITMLWRGAKVKRLSGVNDPVLPLRVGQGAVEPLFGGRAQHLADLIGEIALFAPDRRRTATAVCETDCVLFALTGKKATELCLEHPAFGLFLVRLITSRLIDAGAVPMAA